jgi:hypothetical protein
VPSNDSALSHPLERKPETIYADLETQLLEAVADFGADELSQLLDAAKALRRIRRL